MHVVKNLKIKDMSTTLKREHVIRGIRLTLNPDELEYKLGKSQVVLKTIF